MVDLADGLALRRLAERCADRGAVGELDEGGVEMLTRLIADAEVIALVTRAIGGDRSAAQHWLEMITRMAAHPADDDAVLVTAMAALGNVIIESAADAPTGSFEALAAV
jgi:hypothetical protein